MHWCATTAPVENGSTMITVPLECRDGVMGCSEKMPSPSMEGILLKGWTLKNLRYMTSCMPKRGDCHDSFVITLIVAARCSPNLKLP
jgi:hypothetical protein